MSELVVLRGIPGSGKTRWAMAWVAEDPDKRARVNRDDLRRQLFARDAPLEASLEKSVTICERAMVRQLLLAGRDVVVDATHIRHRYVKDWAEMASEVGASFRVEDRFLEVPVAECVNRDFLRSEKGGRFVGEEVIQDMARRLKTQGEIDFTRPDEYTYVPDEGTKTTYIFDIDGTLALMNDRSPYDLSKVSSDDINHAVARIARTLDEAGHYIILLSGRDESARQDTTDWLIKHDIPFDSLFMRPEGDTRKDSIVKLEIFQRDVAPDHHVLGVFDDRDQVVGMWRGIGLVCFQVAPGAF